MEQPSIRKITIKITGTEKFISALNGVFKLTDTEINVLAALIDHRETVNLCSPSNKKKVAEVLKLKDFNTLNNYVKKLKDKQAIVQTKDGYDINPLLKKETTLILLQC